MQCASMDLLIHRVWLGKALAVLALIYLRTWDLIPPAAGMLAAMGSHLSHSGNCPQLKGTALSHYSLLPGAAYIQCLTDGGAEAWPPCLSTGQIWRTILAPALFMRLAEASVVTALQLSSSLSNPYPLTHAQVFFPNHVPACTPTCQNLLPKEYGLKCLSLEEYIIWNLKKRRRQSCTGPGRKQKQNPWSKGGIF